VANAPLSPKLKGRVCAPEAQRGPPNRHVFHRFPDRSLTAAGNHPYKLTRLVSRRSAVRFGRVAACSHHVPHFAAAIVMEKFSRVLAVLIAVLSVAFMGFAGVVSFGGPNWEAEAKKLQGYTFLESEGQNPTWTATRAVDREALSPASPILPEVLTAAIRDRVTKAKTDRDELVAAIPQVEQQTKTLSDMQAADVPALDAYFQQQLQRLAQTNVTIDETSKQQEMVSAEIRKVEDQLASRREDVFRLELEHRVLVADVERVKQNVGVVEEQIRLLEDELDKAQRRKKDLDDQGIPAAPAPGAPVEAPTPR
jgi:hypothetical protein